MALGWAYAAVRDFERAFGALERATDLNPSLAWAYLAHGTARAAAAPELQREAIGALERAIRLSPRDPFLHWMWTALGSAQSNRGAFPEARSAFETARKLAPDQPHVYPMLAATFVAMGDLERARASVAEVRKLAPQYSPIAHARRFGLAPTLPIYAAALAAAGWEDPDGPFDPSG
jgi:tetratricopeptide (TPR) repeat protein